LSDTQVHLAQVLQAAVLHLEAELEIYPDIVVLLSINTPLRRLEHIQEAINTLLLYQVDEVLSTWEDLGLYYRHAQQGMQAVNPGMLRGLRLEREALYACNGSIHAHWRENIGNPNQTARIGHVIMTKTESLIAKKPEDLRLLELILSTEIDR
jgi:CMP-N-acetylneuraminic acid synthetase